jgi:sulfonate transport system ATP-binding protein
MAVKNHYIGGLALHVESVSKTFGRQTVLQDISLDLKAGEFVAIVGKSGSGKSTLMRLIAGLDTADQGEITIGDEPLDGLNKRARIMFQDARLLPWRKVIENVGLGLSGDWRAQAQDALAEVGLADRADDWPSVLSGGEKQRVALARALVTKPRLLLFDEPLGALDALTRIEMQRLIERLWREEGFTALLITHDVEEAVALGDRVALLEQGKFALDLPIDLPRPHPRGSGEFARLKEYVLNRVLSEKAMASY